MLGVWCLDVVAGRQYFVPLLLVLVADKVTKQRFDVVVLGICGPVASTLHHFVAHVVGQEWPVAARRIASRSDSTFDQGTRSFIHSSHGQAKDPSWCGSRARVSIVSIAGILLPQARSWLPVGSFSQSSDHPSLPHRTSLQQRPGFYASYQTTV